MRAARGRREDGDGVQRQERRDEPTSPGVGHGGGARARARVGDTARRGGSTRGDEVWLRRSFVSNRARAQPRKTIVPTDAGKSPPSPQFLPLPTRLVLTRARASRFSGGSAPPRFVPMASPASPPPSRVRVRRPPRRLRGRRARQAPGHLPPPRRRATPRPRTWASCRASPGSWRRFKTRWTPPTPRATTSLPGGTSRWHRRLPAAPPHRAAPAPDAPHARSKDRVPHVRAARPSSRSRYTRAPRPPPRFATAPSTPSSSACTRTSSSRTAPSPLCSRRTPRAAPRARARPLRRRPRRQAPSEGRPGMGRGARRPAFGSPRAQPRDPRVRRPAEPRGRFRSARRRTGAPRLRASLGGARPRGRPRGGPRRRRVRGGLGGVRSRRGRGRRGAERALLER